MNTYTINQGYDDERTVSATQFSTVGDFIDFYGREVDGGLSLPIVLRMRADRVFTVELTQLEAR
ncbi:hypothetical protein OG988_18785 [Streptomyces zaomyceticus]|uniref:hypothetical protein n=1 Tax=Streptomyces zaomyceticus TaxID=68286 RepID=UPI00324C10CC